MHFPRFMRRVNRVLTNPILGTVAWILPPLAVVHHVGRKTGRRNRAPVIAIPSGDGFVIPLTYGRDVDWAQNLVRAGGGTVQQMGRQVPLRDARIVDLEEASPRLPGPARAFFRVMDFPGFVLADRNEPDAS